MKKHILGAALAASLVLTACGQGMDSICGKVTELSVNGQKEIIGISSEVNTLRLTTSVAVNRSMEIGNTVEVLYDVRYLSSNSIKAVESCGLEDELVEEESAEEKPEDN